MNKKFEAELIANLKGRIDAKKAEDEDIALAFKKNLKDKVSRGVSLSSDLSEVIALTELVAKLEADPNFHYEV